MKYEFTNKSKKASWLLSVALLIFIDQLSKHIIRFYQSVGSGFYICNTGIAFGIKLPDYLFWIIWLAIISAILIWDSKKYSFGLIFILSGAVSNILDRAYFGCVIDFIDLKIWPVFNLADIFITTGAIILLYQLRNSDIKKIIPSTQD